MYLREVKLHNFRSYELFSTKISENGTVIVGPNGTGKTNLLEAIYVTMRGQTFRGSLSDVMRHGENQTIAHLETSNESRRIQILNSHGKISKEFTINDKKMKIMNRKHRLPVVLFEPSELRLITSSPSRRRDFLDGIISRLDENYDKALRAFGRTLLQRNELLKNHQESPQWKDHLFAWDVKFVQHATQIATARAHFLTKHENRLNDLYNSLAGKTTRFGLTYEPSVNIENYDQLLLNQIQKSLNYEIATGFSSCGPQREDFLISIHDQPARKVASRGEMRTIMLAFKLLELELQTEKSDAKPLILMDDVFSELDSTRERLLQETIKNHQFIVTTTDARHHGDKNLIIETRSVV